MSLRSRPTLVRIFVQSISASIYLSLDCAPQFKTLLRRFQAFLAKHGLVDPRTGKPMKRFAFCTDGPFDVRDFCVKTAFINKVCSSSFWCLVHNAYNCFSAAVARVVAARRRGCTPCYEQLPLTHGQRQGTFPSMLTR